MVKHTEADTFSTDKKRNISTKSKKFYSKWWHQKYHFQEIILRIIESYEFRALVIFLVIVDTALVITEILLDSFKIHYECDRKDHHTTNHHIRMNKKHVELAMEIAHYSSVVILIFFTIELIIRIFASGRDFWNIRRRKMEYLDAFIVITSLIIDLSFLRDEQKMLGEQLVLILSFRLWRFIRIISSVAGGIRHGQRKHKDRLSEQYLAAIRRLIELLDHKTDYIEKNNNENLDSLLEHFKIIDNQCQLSFEALNDNHELTSSVVVGQFLDEINGLENKDNDSVISALLIKIPENI